MFDTKINASRQGNGIFCGNEVNIKSADEES